MARYLHLFTVEGTRNFPHDMLRYDSCWPSTSESAADISLTFDRSYLRLNENRTFLINLSGNYEPTEARWESFGWKVIRKNKQKL